MKKTTNTAKSFADVSETDLRCGKLDGSGNLAKPIKIDSSNMTLDEYEKAVKNLKVNEYIQTPKHLYKFIDFNKALREAIKNNQYVRMIRNEDGKLIRIKP
ncbi:MAG: hypothetical protein KQ78_02125 [Candidatus Izimaplasma bacterium HR2]|nr:MAG: hypothetical protein KQ78_02125 [Candidatus Izimaplasma bacterium HR2]